MSVHWKDWCWSWNSNTLATWCKELTHLKRLWCWERLKAGGEGDDRGRDGWMASPAQWTWVWVNSANWQWTGKPGVPQSMGLQRVGQDWATELNSTDGVRKCSSFILLQLVDQFSQNHLLKRLSFLCYILPSFVKDKVSVGAWIYLWAFYFLPLIYISVFVPVPYCLDDYSFAI